MKVLLLLFQLNLLNYAVSFVVRKTKIYPSKPTGFVNNLEQQSSILAAGDIKYTFLADNQFTIDDEIPSIGNLIKSLRIPGFNVYHIVINRDDTGNYENAKSYTKLKTQPEHIPENDHPGTYLSNIEIEKRNDSEALNYNEINMVSIRF
ncbi:uncharacterized protein LOC106714925 [Papilio machaon]|uniref:uncharacterized protein LOC106714925 n=1 Tax=Papilio machaon TaxID=76193 RepID=UPI001E66306A|nr:uncharacterized protein LOC106714925 [Papilio machaon]